MFFDDITEFLTEALSQHQNTIVPSDFNMHINNQDDPEANILMDTMTALGLQQHTTFIMHHSRNTLNLIFTEIIMRQRVLNCTPGSFILDHCAVDITLYIPETNIIRMTIQMGNLKDIDLNQFTKDMGIEEIPTCNLDDMVEVFNKKTNICIRPPCPRKNQKNNKMSNNALVYWWGKKLKKKTQKIGMHMA